jgi:hypothetical protein
MKDRHGNPLAINDTVRLITKDGFNGEIGTIEYIAEGVPQLGGGAVATLPASEYGEFAHIFLGVKQYGRKVVPFQSEEIEKI